MDHKAPESMPLTPPAKIKEEILESLVTDKDRSAQTLLQLFLGTNSSSVRNALSAYEMKFLIATVPDPIDSGLGHLFDAHVAAIQRGAEAAGYVLDRFEIAWTKEKSTKDDTKKVVQGAHEVAKYILDRRRIPELPSDKNAKAADDIERLSRHQRVPGLILFRKPYDKSLLILFLVGETPTIGIHKPALLNALAQIKDICEWGRLRDCGTFRVLAPTFSGSADSLKIAIQTFHSKERWKFNIITGSATATNKKKFLDGIDGWTDLSETISHDTDSIDSFLDFVKNGPRNKDVNPSILDWMDRAA